MKASKSSTSYAASGVVYAKMDPLKRFAQAKAKETSKNLETLGMKEVSESRGESAYVWDEGDSYRAFVIEGLGTKNLVADEVRKLTGKTYYDVLAQDTVAMIVNDLIVVGAKPQVINAYFGLGSSDWVMDEKRSKDLVEGWAKACDLAGAAWGGGETATLKGVILDGVIDLAGSAIGVIKPKSRLVLGDRIQDEDVILFVPSSGIHSNGLSLARSVAAGLKGGYATKLASGETFGEAILKPTHIYARLIEDLFKEGINIHYLVNITGHGFRKLMRAKGEFKFVIEKLPKPQEIFKFIQEKSGNSDEEMYGNFNMGAGFAIYVPKNEAARVIKIGQKHGFALLEAGYIKKGPRSVIIKPKEITFKAGTLGIRLGD